MCTKMIDYLVTCCSIVTSYGSMCVRARMCMLRKVSVCMFCKVSVFVFVHVIARALKHTYFVVMIEDVIITACTFFITATTYYF